MTPSIDLPGLPDVGDWWRAVERSLTAGPESGFASCGRPWLHALEGALAAELTFDLELGRRLLDAEADAVPEGEWRQVHRLLELRVAVRGAGKPELRGLADSIDQLVEAAGRDDSTAARARLLLGTVHRINGAFDEAEAALLDALESVGDGPCRWWVLDGLGLVHQGRGSWIVARHVFETLAKEPAGGTDTLVLIHEPRRGAGVPTFFYQLRNAYRLGSNDIVRSSIELQLLVNGRQRPQTAAEVTQFLCEGEVGA